MPSIVTDKDVYTVGETIYWKATGLTPGHKYAVGVLIGNNLIYAPDRDVFTASSAEASGSYYVGSNIVGANTFALAEFRDSNLYVVATKTVTITGAPTPTPTVPTWVWYVVGAVVAAAAIAAVVMVTRKRY